MWRFCYLLTRIKWRMKMLWRVIDNTVIPYFFRGCYHLKRFCCLLLKQRVLKSCCHKEVPSLTFYTEPFLGVVYNGKLRECFCKEGSWVLAWPLVSWTESLVVARILKAHSFDCERALNDANYFGNRFLKRTIFHRIKPNFHIIVIRRWSSSMRITIAWLFSIYRVYVPKNVPNEKFPVISIVGKICCCQRLLILFWYF